MKTALICGVSGQDGAYLARLLLERDYRVVGTSRDAETNSFAALERLGIKDKVERLSMAPNDFRSVLQCVAMVEPDEIYNLSGQSSVGLSFQQPVETLESIALGTINLLETIRFAKRPIRFYNAGSGECYGDTQRAAADETWPFRPRSPYATAKTTAHHMVSNYRDAYGLFACTGILFNHESPLRPLRFVTRKVIHAASAIKKGRHDKVRLGNLNVWRDWGWAPEYVDAMWRMMQQDEASDFVIATGRSASLREFCEAAFAAVGLELDEHLIVDEKLFRPLEIQANRGDASKARDKLGWVAQIDLEGVVGRMIDAELGGTV